MNLDENLETAIFGGGCFWCTEAIFLEMNGVKSVDSGYIGGTTINPTYKEVCTGTTGHAEAIKIVYDASKITFEELLQIFFATHDPTTLNRQGADVGTQYRSEIFYCDENQKKIAEGYMLQLMRDAIFASPIVTQISEATTFFLAEDYHKNYYNQNKEQSYCSFVVTPKVEKAKKMFKEKLKKT